MKLKIKKRFFDKHNGKRYETNSVVEFPKERAKELLENAPHLVEENDIQTTSTRTKKKADSRKK